MLILTLKTHNQKKELKQISILITVLSHIFAFIRLFAFLFFLTDKCFFFMNNLAFSEITEWEPWCHARRQVIFH